MTGVSLRGIAGALGLVLAGACRMFPAPAERDGWKSLFDGTSLTQWRGYKQPAAPAGWRSVDGTLVRVDGGGDLVSIDTFENFEFAFEWQIAAGGNSGVMFHVSENFEAPYHTGPEYQILDNARHPDGRLPQTRAGSNFGLHAPVRDVAHPAGEWNAARLAVRDGVVEHWLNGVRVVKYRLWDDDWKARVGISKFSQWPNYGLEKRGHLVLQDHGDRVAFRNLWITEGTKATKATEGTEPKR